MTKLLVFNYEQKITSAEGNRSFGRIRQHHRAYEIEYPLSPRGTHLLNSNGINVKVSFNADNLPPKEENQLQTVEEFIAEVHRNSNNKRAQGYAVRTIVTTETTTTENEKTTTETNVVDEDQGGPTQPSVRYRPY